MRFKATIFVKCVLAVVVMKLKALIIGIAFFGL